MLDAFFTGGHFRGAAHRNATNVTVDNVTMDTNRDGIDIDCCRQQRRSPNCRIQFRRLTTAFARRARWRWARPIITEKPDDCELPRCPAVSGRDAAGRHDETDAGRDGAAIKFWDGEQRAGSGNCAVANCHVFGIAAGLALEEVDGESWRNITINKHLDDGRGELPDLHHAWGRRNRRGPNVKRTGGRWRNILISQCHLRRGFSATSGIKSRGCRETMWRE